MMTIAGVVITKNEADNIVDCLSSLHFCDERIVVDSGSNDETVQLAEKYANRVEVVPFIDYATQKNRAASLATSDWILSVDADERISSSLREEVLLAVQQGESGFTVPRLQQFFGRWLRFGGFYPDRQLRLYRKSKGEWRGAVHERVHVEGEVGTLKNPLLHYPYRKIDDWVSAINRHTSVGAEQLARRGDKPSLRRALTTALIHFFDRLIRRGGYRDGGAGWIAAMMVSFEGFLLHAKHWSNANSSRPNIQNSMRENTDAPL